MSNVKKIAVLSKTIKGLQEDTYRYSWFDTGSCNCGIVSQVALDLNETEVANSLSKSIKPELRKVLDKVDEGNNFGDYGPWEVHARAAQICCQTGKPVQEIFQKLIDQGFEYEELIHLEGLTDPKVLAKLRWSEAHTNMTSKDHFIEYLTEWRNILYEQEYTYKLIKGEYDEVGNIG